MEQLRGNAFVGQSGGPTAAINATLAGVIRGAMECDGVGKLYGAKNGIEGVLAKTFIDLSGMTEDELCLLENPPHSAPAERSSRRISRGKTAKSMTIFSRYSVNTTSVISSTSAATTRWIP